MSVVTSETEGATAQGGSKGPLIPIIPDGAPADYKPTKFKRKVVHRVEKREPRQVKVKVVKPKVVPTTYEKRIKVPRLVETVDHVEVEEKYTEFVDEPATREKKIWVARQIQEEYEEKTPVRKKKKVKIPVTNIVEEEDEAEVEVDSHRFVEVKGWRIDEIEDRKMVEVDDWEIFELIPHAVGELIRGETRDLGFLDVHHKNRTLGRAIYKNNEEGRRQAREAGFDLDQIEVDHEWVRRTDGRHSFFVGGRGYTRATRFGDGNEAYDSVPGGEAKQYVEEGFNLDKCLAYITVELGKVKFPADAHAFSIEEFVEQLESRWRFVDEDFSGLVSYEELRLAVWNTEEDNAGVPMPKSGKFNPQLQDIVDEIFHGCGSKQEFTIWDFVRFMLDEQELQNVKIPVPPQSDRWAHAIDCACEVCLAKRQ